MRQGRGTAVQVGVLVLSLATMAILSAVVFGKAYLMVFPLMAATILSPALLSRSHSPGHGGDGGQTVELVRPERTGRAAQREAA